MTAVPTPPVDLHALIDPTDLEAYGLTGEQVAQELTQVLIASASAEVKDAAGSPILSTRARFTSTRPPATIFRLTGPIREVHEVLIGGHEVSDYLVVPGGIYRACGWGNPGPAPVSVDYTFGLDSLPADVKDLVCRMVLTGILNAVDGPEGLAIANGNLSSISIDDFREAYATGAHVEAVTEMTLPERVRERLARRFGGQGATVRGTW